MSRKSKNFKIAILDDNFSVRQSVRVIVDRLMREYDIRAEVFSASDGVEGLGYILVAVPDLIVVDTTLPRYSGREVIEYLETNHKFKGDHLRVTLLHDGSVGLPKSEHFIYIHKQDGNFVKRLEKVITGFVEGKYGKEGKHTEEMTFWRKLKTSFLQLTIFLATQSDLLIRQASTQPFLPALFSYLGWFGCQMLLAVSVTVIYLQRRPKELNNLEASGDAAHFRVRAYPTLSVFLASILLIAMQFGLLLLGGVIVFNSRIESVFADYTASLSVDLGDSIYDSKRVSFDGDTLKLVAIKEDGGSASSSSSSSATSAAASSSSATTSAVSSNSSSSSQAASSEGATSQAASSVNAQTSSAQATSASAPSTSSSAPASSGVLGAKDDKQQSKLRYPVNRPSVEFKQRIRFTTLGSILEESSVNTRASSILPPTKASQNNRPENLITYQLSPDGDDWYYWGKKTAQSAEAWLPATQNWQDSNTIQEVNAEIASFVADVAKNKQLYLKVFLHSDGETQTRLSKITVNRTLEVVTPVEPPPAQPPKGPETNPKPSSSASSSKATTRSQAAPRAPRPSTSRSSATSTSESTSSASSSEVASASSSSSEEVTQGFDWFSVVEPVVLNAADARGDKVVAGRVLVPEGRELEFEENIANMRVYIYSYANPFAWGIAKTEVQAIKRKGGVEYLWQARFAAPANGSVVAAVQLTLPEDGQIFESKFSTPLSSE